MKMKQYVALAMMSVGLFALSSEASSSLPPINDPSSIKSIEKSPASLSMLSSLLTEGKTPEFYKEVNKFYDVEYPDLQNKESVQKFLWLYYYLSRTPLLPFDDYDDNTSPFFYDNVDVQLKRRSLKRSLKIARNDLDEIAQTHQLNKKELSAFFAQCSARMLYDLRKACDSIVPGAGEKARKKQGEDALVRSKLLAKSRDPEQMHEALFGGKESLRSRNLENKIACNDKRVAAIRTVWGYMEKYFMETLVKLFPEKKETVMKYIKSAGYENAEVYSLIDRTVGRTGETAFLHKNRPKSTMK